MTKLLSFVLVTCLLVGVRADQEPKDGNVVPQGIVYFDREKYEENRTYYQVINPVIKIK